MAPPPTPIDQTSIFPNGLNPHSSNSSDQDGPYHLFDDVLHLTSAKNADHDLQYLTALRAAFPSMVVTAIPTSNTPLIAFAAAGHATAELDKETDGFASWRGYVGPSAQARNGSLAENVHFGKYMYQWAGEAFVVYSVGGVQYVLKERAKGEHPLGPSAKTDKLIRAVGGWLLDGVVWVYDGYWYQDKKLYQQVQKATWEKVILDEGMKKELTEAAEKFFDSKDVYDDLGVPWKRGLLFYGPPGNGKTISIKALMHTLLNRKQPIPTLYVKAAPSTYNIQAVFSHARNLAPCMLILEDIETIVTPQTRSYFFNEMDGIEDNSGIFVVGSTNYLERLDPGLTSRPSRFDRKYLFPLPNLHERTLYCQWWKRKLAQNDKIEFPDTLCEPMARITDAFSFAFLQEAFVGSMLYLAHQSDEDKQDADDEDLEKYELWRVFKKQVATLRKEIRDENVAPLPMPPEPAPGGHRPSATAMATHVPEPLFEKSRSMLGGVTNTALVPSSVDPQGQEFLGMVGGLNVRDEQAGVARLGTIKRTVINSRAYAMQ